jgi:competence protein ComEC
MPAILLAVIFFLGGWRYLAIQPVIDRSHAAFYNDRGRFQLMGVVSDQPDPRDSYVNLTVEVEDLEVFEEGGDRKSTPVDRGKVLVQAPAGSSFAYGDRVRFRGELQTPFESAEFSYREHLARKEIHSVMPYAQVMLLEPNQGNPVKAWIYRLQEKGYTLLQVLFPSPESALLSGILLGRDQGLSPALQEAFRRTGTTHIIAISGFNMAILAGLFSGIFTRLLGRKWGAITAVVGITGYTILVGAEAAVVRAAIMGILGVLGGMFGRRQNGINSLGLAALVMMVLSPFVIWDIGFQLSIAATLGLVLYAQPMEEKFVNWAANRMPEERAEKLAGPIGEFFLFTLAAQVMTLPIIAYHFRGISWLALFANPLILPPQALVMILGGLALLCGLVFPGLGALVAMTALPLLRYTIRTVSWLGQLPAGEVSLPRFHVLWLAVFYAVLFVLTLFPRETRQKIYKRLFSLQTGALLLFSLVFLVWNRALSLPDDNLHLTLLDAEGTLLIQAPAGYTVLVGGGDSPSTLHQQLGQMLPAGDQRLNVLIVASASRDDLNGLSGGIGRVSVEKVLWGIDPQVNQTARSVYKLMQDKSQTLHTLETGQALELGGGTRLTVLRSGERGAMLWLEWNKFYALIPAGKLDSDGWTVPNAPDVVLLPDNLSTEDLPLAQIIDWSPSAILLPLGSSDLPLSGEHELLCLFEGYPLLNTLNQGWIRVSTDGEKLWVSGEK